jgi:hypothetical protein
VSVPSAALLLVLGTATDLSNACTLSMPSGCCSGCQLGWQHWRHCMGPGLDIHTSARPLAGCQDLSAHSDCAVCSACTQVGGQCAVGIQRTCASGPSRAVQAMLWTYADIFDAGSRKNLYNLYKRSCVRLNSVGGPYSHTFHNSSADAVEYALVRCKS